MLQTDPSVGRRFRPAQMTAQRRPAPKPRNGRAVGEGEFGFMVTGWKIGALRQSKTRLVARVLRKMLGASKRSSEFCWRGCAAWIFALGNPTESGRYMLTRER